MDFSKVKIEINGDCASLNIDGVDFPTVRKLQLNLDVDKPPTLDLSLYCMKPAEKNLSDKPIK